MLEFSKIANRYSVVRKLHNRGLTTVFLARDERGDDRQVVAELTPIGRDEAPELAERRRAMLGLLTQLEHPNLAAVIDATVDAPYLCVVKAWETGVPLFEWLAAGEGEAWPQRVALARDVLEGLAALHSAGLLHRDLRPRNVWVTTSGGRPTAQLDHFLEVVPEGEPGGTQVGDPKRWPPEVLRAGEYSRRSDIYSVGLLLFDLLSRRDRVGDFDGAPTEADLDTVPPPYGDVVRRACRPFSVERFDDGLDLLAAFDAMDLKRRLAEAGFDDGDGDGGFGFG
ncbi:MAG: protein kinase [Acidobacteriota bacterium]